MKKNIHNIHKGARGNNRAQKNEPAHGKKETCENAVSYFSQGAKGGTSSRIEIIENSFEWTVEPGNGCAGNGERKESKREHAGAGKDAGRNAGRTAYPSSTESEELRERRKRHYAAMAAAGVLPEEAPFEESFGGNAGNTATPGTVKKVLSVADASVCRHGGDFGDSRRGSCVRRNGGACGDCGRGRILAMETGEMRNADREAVVTVVAVVPDAYFLRERRRGLTPGSFAMRHLPQHPVSQAVRVWCPLCNGLQYAFTENLKAGVTRCNGCGAVMKITDN